MQYFHNNDFSLIDKLIDNNLLCINRKEYAVIALPLPPLSLKTLFDQLASIAGKSWVFFDQKFSDALKNR